MADLDLYDEDTVDKAFWLQEKIYEYGLEPVGFSRAARLKIKKEAGSTVRANLRKYL
jgi:hypothetical protein